MSSQLATTSELSTQPEWLFKIAAPLGADGSGEDSRYSDHFGVIKGEIDKLKGNDFHRVEQLCMEVLAAQSKDLRLAGYLLLAKTYTAGITGLLEAVRIYITLVEGFAETVHPQKQALRLRALEWLNNRKLESYVRLKIAAAEKSQLLELRSLLSALNQAIQAAYGESAPCWTSLNSVLDAKLQQGAVEAAQEAVAAPAGPAQWNLSLAGHATADAKVVGPGAITSERDLLSATRAIREYLLGTNDIQRAIGFSRALRWGALQLPPNDNGKTRIPAPRQTALNELQQLAEGNSPDALLSLCENLFLEPGGHLLLDLQRFACEAAKRMGRTELAEFITEQTLMLVRRLPELPSLQFENEYPFADLNTRSWFEQRLLPTVASNLDRDGFSQELEALMESGRQLLRQKQLPAALNLLKGCIARDERQRLQLQLAKARLCLEAGKAGIALPLIEVLASEIEAQSLAVWEPELAIAIWKLQIEASQSSLKKAAAEEKVALNATIVRLKRQICCVDPEIAARLL